MEERPDLSLMHLEADLIIIHWIHLAETGKKDHQRYGRRHVFILLVHLYAEKRLSCSLMMLAINYVYHRIDGDIFSNLLSVDGLLRSKVLS